MMTNLYGLYRLGYTHVTMALNKKRQKCKFKQIFKKRSQFGLLFGSQQYEVGITSNRKLERYGEFVNKSCTHRPSRHENRLYIK